MAGCCRPAPPGPCRGSSRAWSPRRHRLGLEEWRVAGKTGTARKAGTVAAATGRGLCRQLHRFAPAEKPAVVVAVVIDEPTRGCHGGSVAAPVFQEVTSTALRRLEVVPTLPARAVR